MRIVSDMYPLKNRPGWWQVEVSCGNLCQKWEISEQVLRTDRQKRNVERVCREEFRRILDNLADD